MELIKLNVDSRCDMHLCRHRAEYRVSTGKGDAPVKAEDHAMDELRYYLMSKPRSHTPPKGEESMQERYKKKLMRRTRRSK